MFNTTFNNISVISWHSVLLVEETGENHRPVASYWQTLSHNKTNNHLSPQIIEHEKKTIRYSAGNPSPSFLLFLHFCTFLVWSYTCFCWLGLIMSPTLGKHCLSVHSKVCMHKLLLHFKKQFLKMFHACFFFFIRIYILDYFWISYCRFWLRVFLKKM